MNREGLIRELKRLVAGSPGAVERMDRGDQEAYVTEILNFYGWKLTDLDWKNAVDWMLQNRRSKGLPTISEIGTSIESARKAGLVRAGGPGCQACGNSGQVGGMYLRRILDGEVAEFYRPCPKCSRAKDVEPPYGWELISVQTDRLLLQAMSMSPAAARRVISQLDESARAQKDFREDVYLALVNRAGQPDVPKPPPIRPLRDVIAEIMPPKPTARQVDV